MGEWLSKNKSAEATDLEIRGKKIPKVIVQILKNRGYNTPMEIEKFFAPSLSDLYDPFLINDMEPAVDRIIRAINQKERVLIHGDYDTDGISGAALLINNLKKFGLDVEYYIPQRLVEGYGLSTAGINLAIKNRCSLVITVDCGISAVSEVMHARHSNIDVIICDHHKPKENLPQAYALVNPKIPGNNYPFKELAGVGVAFKILEGLHEKLHKPKDDIYSDLDLVALGSVVDVVPLIDENRILVKYGMKKIISSQKAGFKAILEETGIKHGITSYHIGFILGPRINACGRLRDAKEALELFLTDDLVHASRLARNLSQDNQTRKAIEDAIYNEARTLIERTARDKNRIIVIGKEDWHEGVLGIVASRISTDYFHPAIILSLKKNIVKGSARSVPGFDITDAIGKCEELLIKYGGHSQAAGLELNRDNLANFETKINEYAQRFDLKIFEKKSIYDVKLDLDGITDEVIYFLKFFEPTGTTNPQPVFLGENFEVVGIPRVIGADHLKFALRNRGAAFSAIAYGQAENILDIEVGKTRVNCLYSIAEDSFLGKRKTVLKVKEMKKCT